jgi:hypothetical protein
MKEISDEDYKDFLKNNKSIIIEDGKKTLELEIGARHDPHKFVPDDFKLQVVKCVVISPKRQMGYSWWTI